MPDVRDIGPYRIVRPLATGGMAQLYLAKQRAIEGVERLVVVKEILPKYAENDEFVTMFLDEARLMAALNHPNITSVFDVGQVGRSFFLVMEYIRGPTLRQVLANARERGQRLALRDALGISLAVAEALHYVHACRDEHGQRLRIVHRDLNPSNVLISYDGGVKLIDFGIAKAATKVYETRTGVVKGTYGYIAPEQLRGASDVDHRADVFALGVLMYEMTVGQHPFDLSDEPSAIDRILEAKYPPPGDVEPSLPPALSALITRCLSPAPAGRPSDMGELIEALATVLGARGEVPTQSALASAVREFVPDEDGRLPVRPLLTRARPDESRSWGTASIRPRDASREREGTTPSVKAGAFADKGGNDSGDVTLDLASSGLVGLDAVEEDDVTLAQPRWTENEEELEAPTRLVSLPKPTEGNIVRLGRGAADIWARLRNTTTETGESLGQLVGLMMLGMLAAGTGTYFVVRWIEGPEPASTPSTVAADPTETAERAEVRLSIISEPPGATAYVDGRQLDGVTPLTLVIPADEERVWVRVTKAGFHPAERQVISRVGQVRFVLRATE